MHRINARHHADRKSRAQHVRRGAAHLRVVDVGYGHVQRRPWIYLAGDAGGRQAIRQRGRSDARGIDGDHLARNYGIVLA